MRGMHHMPTVQGSLDRPLPNGASAAAALLSYMYDDDATWTDEHLMIALLAPLDGDRTPFTANLEERRALWERPSGSDFKALLQSKGKLPLHARTRSSSPDLRPLYYKFGFKMRVYLGGFPVGPIVMYPQVAEPFLDAVKSMLPVRDPLVLLNMYANSYPGKMLMVAAANETAIVHRMLCSKQFVALVVLQGELTIHILTGPSIVLRKYEAVVFPAKLWVEADAGGATTLSVVF